MSLGIVEVEVGANEIARETEGSPYMFHTERRSSIPISSVRSCIFPRSWIVQVAC